MGFSVVHERDLAIGRGVRIYRNGTHAAARACCVLHDDMVDRGAMAGGQLVARPIGRNAGVDPQTRLTAGGRQQLQAETRSWQDTTALIARFFKVRAEDLT